jgi:hypothetical protein
MGLSIEADAEMLPRRPISTTAFAFKAQDANTLEGVGAAALDQSAHVSDTANPHNVTAAQTGAATSADLNAHEGDASAHHVKTSTFPELSGQIADSQIPPLIARDTEIMPTVLGNDGPGSTLNADLLDGLSSEAFMPIGTDQWVNTTGDTMTGALTVPRLNVDTGFSEVINIDATGTYSWLRWEENGSTRGYIGYSGVNTFWGGNVETEDAFVIRGNTALHLGDDELVLTIDNNSIGIGTTSPTNLLDIEGDQSTYLASIVNDSSTYGAFGLRNIADAYDVETATSIAFFTSATGGNTGGSAYGVRSFAYAYGSSTAFGVYSEATGGFTSGNEYAFYGIGKGYISQDLDVNGTSYIGYERIAGNASSLSATISSCGMIRSGTCYYGNASVSCPTGKVAIGGGCSCNSSYNCGLIRNYASSSSSWFCSAVATSSTYSVTPIVHCARVAN